MENRTAETFAVWSDLASLLLAGVCMLLGGVNPVCPIWGRPPLQNFLLAVFMPLLIAFTAARFVVEGAYHAAGPREFLAVSVVYAARWLWLFLSMQLASTRRGRLFAVARELRAALMLRLGKSTHDDRKGEPELVVRRGARSASGPTYWRAVEESAVFHHPAAAWEVHLVEEDLHGDFLNIFGTVDYGKDDPFSLHDAYRRMYEVVMTVETNHPALSVNYGPFFREFSGVGVSDFARRAGAVDLSDLANVARRVAADSCFFVKKGGQLRTRRQIELINACLTTAAAAFLASAPSDSIGALDL